MANTYTQIHIQTILVVKWRSSLISPAWEDELYKYITRIVQKHGHKLLQINGIPNHVHIFFGMRPTQALSDLMQEVKQSSSGWINKKNLTQGHFSWQPGFSAFSYCRSHVDSVCAYIANQKEHHKKESLMEEYHRLLEEFDVDFDDRYIFHPPI